MAYDYTDPEQVMVALITESPWPDMERTCSGAGTDSHEARWVIWTSKGTGDGMRFACDEDLGIWVRMVAARLWPDDVRE